MPKCYYCTGVGYCEQCRKKAAPVPSPNGASKASEPLKQTAKQARIAQLDNSTSEKKYYGWISKQFDRHSSPVVYRRPDGSEVQVSFVSQSPDHHGTGWTDCQCIGEVTEYVRRT